MGTVSPIQDLLIPFFGNGVFLALQLTGGLWIGGHGGRIHEPEAEE